MRSSLPSGSTMWAFAARARVMSCCSNISGVTAPGVVAPRWVEQRFGVDVLREKSFCRFESCAGIRDRDSRERREGRGGRHRSARATDDRQLRAQAVDQPLNLR
jgi:hypothetical protein